jgi:hypothetical protein
MESSEYAKLSKQALNAFLRVGHGTAFEPIDVEGAARKTVQPEPECRLLQQDANGRWDRDKDGGMIFAMSVMPEDRINPGRIRVHPNGPLIVADPDARNDAVIVRDQRGTEELTKNVHGMLP